MATKVKRAARVDPEVLGELEEGLKTETKDKVLFVRLDAELDEAMQSYLAEIRRTNPKADSSKAARAILRKFFRINGPKGVGRTPTNVGFTYVQLEELGVPA
jgi:hypothetical protein